MINRDLPYHLETTLKVSDFINQIVCFLKSLSACFLKSLFSCTGQIEIKGCHDDAHNMYGEKVKQKERKQNSEDE